MKKQYIIHEPQDRDAWVCLCGNMPSENGFYPCDTEGNEVDPAPGEWDGELYVCNQCKRIINQETLEVVA